MPTLASHPPINSAVRTSTGLLASHRTSKLAGAPSTGICWIIPVTIAIQVANRKRLWVIRDGVICRDSKATIALVQQHASADLGRNLERGLEALATAAAGIIVGVVAMGLGGLITEVIDVLSGGNIFMLLIITAVASLIIGMGLPTTATYIVMASLTAPVIVEVGGYMDFIVPLMSAHLFCFYFGILADDTPPVGLAAYAAAAIAKSPPIPTGLQGFMYDIRTAILPFMFIFNSDLILHNINSWIQGLLIFAMACVGNFAFASATQGWFVARNKFYEIPLFLFVTLNLMRPDLIARWIGLPHGQRYWTYLIGLALFGVLYIMQRPRSPKPVAEPAAA